MSMEKQEHSALTIEQQSDLIVKVFQVSLDALTESGLDEVDALNGMLSQIAVLVEPDALSHAVDLNKQYRTIYLEK
ncbi:MAG: hypothetical protein P8L82_10080 [Paracoccaceae bacterium]|nr:hypothetical protein [Paracoccaceae bacterium]